MRKKGKIISVWLKPTFLLSVTANQELLSMTKEIEEKLIQVIEIVKQFQI